jgi:hypothetical protein
MFGLTAPGDGSRKLQSTDPLGSPVTVKPARTWPVDVTGRTTTLTVGAATVVAAAASRPDDPASTRTAAARAGRARMATPIGVDSVVRSIDNRR